MYLLGYYIQCIFVLFDLIKLMQLRKALSYCKLVLTVLDAMLFKG